VQFQMTDAVKSRIFDSFRRDTPDDGFGLEYLA
jgi:hypothetical protein